MAYNNAGCFHGQTICHALSFNPRSQQNDLNSKQNLKLKHKNEVEERRRNIPLICIDKISSLDVAALGNASQPVSDNVIWKRDLPFGGIVVVFCWDFTQISPTSSPLICEDVIKDVFLNKDTNIYRNDPQRNGIEFFKHIRFFRLTKQVRAASDISHVKFIEQIRVQPNQDSIEYLFRHQITTDDLVNDTWLSATIAVPTNFERISLNFVRLREFAIKINLPALCCRGRDV